MADEFPAALQKFAVPSASQNTAGVKPPLEQTPAKAAPRKRAAVKQKLQPPPPHLSRQAPDIHQQLDQISAGKIKHGNKSPYVTGPINPSPEVPDIDLDPFTVDTPIADPVRMQAMKNAALHELGAEPGDEQNDYENEAVDIPIHLPPPRPRPILTGNAQGGYLSKTVRVMLEVKDGTFTIPVTDVKESRLSMLLLLPLHDNATIFIPKPGTQLFLTYKDKTTKVYYPGTYVEVPELHTGFMSLIKADEETV